MQIRRRLDEAPPQAYFVGSAIFHYLGPAFAVLLFARVDVARGRVAPHRERRAHLRLLAAAVAQAARAGRSGRAAAAGVGVRARDHERVLLRGDRAPAAGHRCRDRVPAGDRPRRRRSAHASQRLRPRPGGGRRVPADRRAACRARPRGSRSRSANALLFALYIVLGDRVAKREVMGGIDGLAAAMLVSAVVVTPIGAPAAVRALADPIAIAAGVGVGITSSVIPYVCDQLALARLARATYALLVSLLPATAAVIGVLVLTQIPAWSRSRRDPARDRRGRVRTGRRRARYGGRERRVRRRRRRVGRASCRCVVVVRCRRCRGRRSSSSSRDPARRSAALSRPWARLPPAGIWATTVSAASLEATSVVATLKPFASRPARRVGDGAADLARYGDARAALRHVDAHLRAGRSPHPGGGILRDDGAGRLIGEDLGGGDVRPALTS